MDSHDADMMRGLPIGTSNFRKLRENDSYYVDKTGLIIDILDNKDVEAFLFTRPRRFGKSLSLSMIDAFFNIEYEGNTWFKGLEVSESALCAPHRNRYPVASLSLKGLDLRNAESFERSLADKISDVFCRFGYLCTHEDDSPLTKRFCRIRSGEADLTDLGSSFKLLTRMLAEHHGRRAIVLIDEYDSPANSSRGEPVQKEAIGFVRRFMAETLKDNDSLEFGIVTGVMQIAKEDMFSGMNNLYVNNVFSEDMGERFGFTESEVRRLVAEAGRPEMMADIREWYDGYRFGNSDVYNPWSILNCVKKGFRMSPYWIWEGNPEMILDCIKNLGPEATAALAKIYNDETVVMKVKERLTSSDLGSLEGLLSLMIASGYLKAVPSQRECFSFSLPNREVREGLMEQLVSAARISGKMNDVSKAILSGDPDGLCRFLQESLDRSADVSLLRDEYDYGLFTLGLLDCMSATHFIRPERGAGKGYADIAVIPRDGKGPSAVLELKKPRGAPGGESLSKSAEDAILQIKERRYFADLHGEVMLYGIAFRQTDVSVSFERVARRE